MPERRDTIEKLVGDDYRICFGIANDLYRDEATVQACCATLMIQFNNMQRQNPKLYEVMKEYESEKAQFIKARELFAQKAEELERTREEYEKAKAEEDIGMIIREYWAPIVEVFPKAGAYLDVVLSRSEKPSFNDIKERMTDYMARNGVAPAFIGAVTPISEDANERSEENVPTDD